MREKPLRGCKAIAEMHYGDAARWRSIHRQCKDGRFPHFRDGNVYCAYPSVIRKWVRLQQIYAMCGRKWGPQDVLEHFGEIGDCTV